MELADLTRHQQIALVALIEKIAMSDGTVVEGEQKEIAHLTEKLGEDNYRELLDEVDERIPDREELKKFLTTIDSQEVRNVIYGTAMEEVMLAPSTNHEQSDFLAWLKEKWAIQVQE